jgi:hypothetical protein
MFQSVTIFFGICHEVFTLAVLSNLQNDASSTHTTPSASGFALIYWDHAPEYKIPNVAKRERLWSPVCPGDCSHECWTFIKL